MIIYLYGKRKIYILREVWTYNISELGQHLAVSVWTCPNSLKFVVVLEEMNSEIFMAVTNSLAIVKLYVASNFWQFIGRQYFRNIIFTDSVEKC
jgi:hypothetical protein